TLPDLWAFRGALTGTPSSACPDAPETPPRIGFCKSPIWEEGEAGMRTALENAATELRAAGAFVGDVELPESFAGIWDAHARITSFEAWRGFAWERTHHRDQLSEPFREGRMKRGAACSDEDYRAAQAVVAECRRDLEAVFGRYDLLLTPSAPGEAPIGLSNTGSARFNCIWTACGVPCLTLPCGNGPNRMPLGVQLVARFGGDANLVAHARWVERALR
ncbi:MAG: amidase family protein, partial [Acetobacterales bacterium]